MNLEIVKAIGSVLVSAGVGNVITNACTHVTPSNISRLGKLANTVGAIAIGLFVSDHVTNYVETQFDDCVEKIQKTMTDDEDVEAAEA